ncbi:MAG: alpha/beta hydrolase [Acidobacteriota bacterium]
MLDWPDARFRMQRTRSGDLALRRRDGDRGALLFIHGLGESGLCFERLASDARLDGWDHLIPDLPGYGGSSWPQAERLERGLTRHVEALLALLDRLAIPRATVLGHSLGGVLATLLAEAAPERVAAVINIEGNLSLDDCTASAFAASQSIDDWLEHGREALLSQLEEDTTRIAPRRVLRAYAASVQLCDPRAFLVDSRELVELSMREELAGRLARLPCPTVYLFGRPHGTGPRSLELLERAGAESHAFEPAGHWPYLEQPNGFAALVAALLERFTDEDAAPSAASTSPSAATETST